MDKQYKVLSVEVFREGTTQKNGKTFKWSIKKLKLDSYDGDVTGYDKVAVGDMVTLTEKPWEKNGSSGVNISYQTVTGGSENIAKSEPRDGGPSDKRTLKLLVLVSDALYRMQKQMALPEEELLTPEKVKEALQVN